MDPSFITFHDAPHETRWCFATTFASEVEVSEVGEGEADAVCEEGV